MPYGQWVRPDRFRNFQDLLAIYLNQLKLYAYRLESQFKGASVVRRKVESTGEHGYTIRVADINDVINYLKLTKFCERKIVLGKYVANGTEQTISLGSKVKPGSIVIAGNVVIVDDGNGGLVGVDKSRRYDGSVNYDTGSVSITLDNENERTGEYIATAAVYPAAKVIEAYTPARGAVTGTTYYKIENVVIPLSESSLFGMTMTMNTSENEFYLGITSPPIAVAASPSSDES